jgi:hypothetical protein
VTGPAVQTGIAVVVFTDGRDYLRQCLDSTTDMFTGPVTEWWMHDDTGDDRYRAELQARYPTWRHIGVGPRRGFGGAIQHVWRVLRVTSSARHVAHVEDDFTFRRPVDLAAMAAVLDAQPYLAQMVLRRQPWSGEEHAAGGVVERHPEAYAQRFDDTGRAWLEHRLFWSTNPSLYRRTILGLEWPYGDQSEGRFGLRLLEHGMHGIPGPDVRFGYWGRGGDGPHVDHIGAVRVGTGY